MLWATHDDVITYEVKLLLNVPKEHAEFLYDEIDALLTIGIETALERTTGSDRLERVVSAKALTTYLREQLKNDDLVVDTVQIWKDLSMLKQIVGVKITVPNMWAVNYGKDFDNRLAETLDYLSEDQHTEIKPAVSSSSTIIGTIQYDQLSHKMKIWVGNNWKDMN